VSVSATNHTLAPPNCDTEWAQSGGARGGTAALPLPLLLGRRSAAPAAAAVAAVTKSVGRGVWCTPPYLRSARAPSAVRWVEAAAIDAAPDDGLLLSPHTTRICEAGTQKNPAENSWRLSELRCDSAGRAPAWKCGTKPLLTCC
jgi:hypothetical protein